VPEPSVSINQSLLQDIHNIAQHVKDVAPPKKVSLAEHMRRRAPRTTLTHQVSLNGGRLRERYLKDEEIELLNQLRPGKYLDGKVTVVERNGVGSGGAIDIVYSNASQEQRINFYMAAPSLTVLCQKILAEQAEHSARPAR
jgi:hypothetical protein